MNGIRSELAAPASEGRTTAGSRCLAAPLLLIPAVLAVILARPVVAAPAVIERIAGSDRYETGARLSAQAFPSAITVYVATGDGFADALAAGPAAAARRAPVLLVAADQLPPATADEIGRLRPSTIVIVGGESVISQAVENELGRLAPQARRIAGPNRFATAAAISADVFLPGVPTAYIGSGLGFADALSGGAAAAAVGSPLLLSEPDAIPPETAAELGRLRPASIVVLGGRASLSDSVEQGLARYTSGAVRRLAGPDRASTSVSLSSDSFRFGSPVVVLATGQAFPDALAGSAAAAQLGGPLLLVQRDCVTIAVNNELNRLSPARILLLGGAVTATPSVEQRTECPTTFKTVGVDTRSDVRPVASSNWAVVSSSTMNGRQFGQILTARFCNVGCFGTFVAEYDLGRQFATFRAVAGQLDRSAGRTGSVLLEVQVDGATLFRRDVRFGELVPVDLNVVGGLRLRLTASVGPSQGVFDAGFADPVLSAS